MDFLNILISFPDNNIDQMIVNRYLNYSDLIALSMCNNDLYALQEKIILKLITDGSAKTYENL